MLSGKDYCGISNGSACTSHSYAPSYVLRAMGLSEEEIDQSIRLSWGRNIKAEDVKTNFKHLLETAKELI